MSDLSAEQVETLTDAECPSCHHAAHYHHPIGSCSVTTYGPPEDGFLPTEHCDCDWPFADALAPTVAALVAEVAAEAHAEAEALRERIEALADRADARGGVDHRLVTTIAIRAALTPADTPEPAAAARHPRWQPGTTNDGVTWRTCCASYRHEHHHQPNCPTSRPEASHG